MEKRGGNLGNSGHILIMRDEYDLFRNLSPKLGYYQDRPIVNGGGGLYKANYNWGGTPSRVVVRAQQSNRDNLYYAYCEGSGTTGSNGNALKAPAVIDIMQVAP
jgi:hypothetical protein